MLARRYETEILDRYIPPALTRARSDASVGRRRSSRAGSPRAPARRRRGRGTRRPARRPRAREVRPAPGRAACADRASRLKTAKTRTAASRDGSTGRAAALAIARYAGPDDRRTSRGMSTIAAAHSVTRVANATPQIPTARARTIERTRFAPTTTSRIVDEAPLKAAGHQVLGKKLRRLVNDQDDAEQREHRRARAPAGPDPAVDQLVGDEDERQREQQHQRHPEPEAGEQQVPLALARLGSLELGERRVEQVGRTRAEAHDEAEDARRDAVERGGLRAEDDADDDHVTRVRNLRGEVDQEVVPAERHQLAHAPSADERAPKLQERQLAPQPEQRRDRGERASRRA